MNKLTKIGLTALAGSLISVSAHAGSMSVSGSASLTIGDSDVDNTQADTSTDHEGNLWTMGDSLTFTGSGDMDNGMSISVSFEVDNDDTGGGDVYDSHSMTLDTNGMGTVTFAGHGGDSAMSAIDDVTPNAYEESWDGVANGDEETLVGGITSDNMFTYKSPDIGGAVVTVGYVPGGTAAKTTAGSYMDFAVAVTPEAVEGLTLGFGMGETEATAGTVIDKQALYAKYTYGSITVGYQMNEADGPASSDDVEFTAAGITYAITDDISVGYNQSSSDLASAANDQEATGFSASYTSGGITVGGMINSVDNVSHSTKDAEGYEFNISFAF
jgi:outer membrane protein OmpU